MLLQEKKRREINTNIMFQKRHHLLVQMKQQVAQLAVVVLEEVAEGALGQLAIPLRERLDGQSTRCSERVQLSFLLAKDRNGGD
jgi:hypothetical protein